MKGGLGLLNLWWYYQAAQLSQFSIIYPKGPKPDWVNMEREAVPNYTLDFLLWNLPKRRPPILAPTLSHSMALCASLHKMRPLTSTWQPLAHIFHNPRFPPGLDIQAFKWWLDKGLYRIGHFFNSNGPLALPYCTSKLDKPPSEKFRFYQISHFLKLLWKSSEIPLSVTPYEQWCSSAVDTRGGISVIYSSLAEPSEKTTYMLSWERDLDLSWDLDLWHSNFARSFKGILNTSLTEASLKTLTRWYLVPSRLAKYYQILKHHLSVLEDATT